MDDVDIAQTRIEAELENLIAEHIYQLGRRSGEGEEMT